MLDKRSQSYQARPKSGPDPIPFPVFHKSFLKSSTRKCYSYFYNYNFLNLSLKYTLCNKLLEFCWKSFENRVQKSWNFLYYKLQKLNKNWKTDPIHSHSLSRSRNLSWARPWNYWKFVNDPKKVQIINGALGFAEWFRKIWILAKDFESLKGFGFARIWNL